MKSIFLFVISFFFTVISYGQYNSTDISVGGSFEATIYADKNNVLLFEPVAIINLTPRLSIGISTKIRLLFFKTEDQGWMIEPYLKYHILNKRVGFSCFGGAQAKSNISLSAPYNPDTVTPFFGAGLNYFITEQVVIDLQLKNYVYKKSEILRNDQKVSIHFFYKF